MTNFIRGLRMKKLFVVFISVFLLFGASISPVYAGGDKNQNEHGSDTAPGPGDDSRGNQVNGD
jgi:hypothetical protein